MSGRCLKFTFDNPEVAGRFIDGVMALENMKGVTITIDDIAAEELGVAALQTTNSTKVETVTKPAYCSAPENSACDGKCKFCYCRNS
jgi:hypothetical protein